MIRCVRLFHCVVFFALCAISVFSQTKAFQVLAFYSTNVEKDHVDFATQMIPFFEAVAKRDHFIFKTTSNWSDLNPETLKDYQVVLWLNEFPATEAERKAFAGYMEHGGA